MSGNIYFSTPASAPTPPTPINTDIYLESVLQGQISNLAPIYVELEDSGGAPITPISSSLVGNTLTAVLPTPAPSGVALQFPRPIQGVSYRNYDVGWRVQSMWYNYTPPAYPLKYAELDYGQGVNSWYKLKYPLRVNGVLSSERFVDLSGVQGWSALNNLNLAVLDKLTGLMFTRFSIVSAAGGGNWIAQFTTAFNYSATILGNTYSDWYLMGASEASAIWGMLLPTTNWVDPLSSQIIVPTAAFSTNRICLAESSVNASTFVCQGYNNGNSAGGSYNQINTNETLNNYFYVHDARNLISA